MVAYLGENHSVCRGCSLRTMVLLIMLSPSSLVMAVRVVHLCPGFLLLSRTIYICSLPQFSSVSQSCPTLCDPMNHSTPGLPVHNQLLESTQTHVHRIYDAIQSYHSVVPFSSCPHSFPASRAFQMSQLFTSGGQSIGVSASTSNEHGCSSSPSNEHPGLISFRMDWLDLLAVPQTLKSLLQHYSSKASILWHSAFFTVQLSHPYMTIGKTIALTRRTFIGKVMSLLFNMLSRLVITFFPRSKRLLIS